MSEHDKYCDEKNTEIDEMCEKCGKILGFNDDIGVPDVYTFDTFVSVIDTNDLPISVKIDCKESEESTYEEEKIE